MGKKGLWLFPVFALFSLLLTQCSTSKVDPYQNTLNADKIIMNGGLNTSGSRGQAQSLYADALNNLGKGDPHYDFISSHANFGLAMIGTWNGLDTISSLLSSTNLLGGSSSGCQPIDLSAYQTLLGPVIDNMLSPIVAHLQAVSTFTGFSFTINTANLVILKDMGELIPSLAGQSISIDMSGAYDLGETDGMLSLLETIQGGADVLFSYNGVLNAVANLLIGLTKTGCTMPNPLLDPNFGTLTSNGAQLLSNAQYLLSDAAKNMSNGLGAIMARTGDNSAHGFINYVDNDKNGKYDPPTSTTNGDTWSSEIVGQLLAFVFQILPKVLPAGSGSSSITSLLPSLPLVLGCNYKTQKTQGQCLSNALFIGDGFTIPSLSSLLSGLLKMNITIPALSRLILLTDFQSVSNALYASIIDNNGQHPLDIIPAIPVLVPRLLPVLEPLLAGLGSSSSTLGPLIGMLPTLVTAMFDSTGDAYISLPVLPSIDLGAFLSNPPPDLKAFAPLSYKTSDPVIGASAYIAPEAFADGFVHVPASEDPNGAGYWTASASFSPGTAGSLSGPGNVLSGTVNGSCDAVTVITDSTTGTPLTYTITGPCTGNPTSASYSGEWYADSGDNVWHAGTKVCNSTQSNTPCFVDLNGDAQYHNAGDIIEQSDEEQSFPFTGSGYSLDYLTATTLTTVTAWSDSGTDRVPDNLEFGYNLSTNPDPYGDDITCTTLDSLSLGGLSINLPWPIPNSPAAAGNAVCGEKNGQPDFWNGSLFSLLYAGVYINASGLGIPLSLGAILPLGSLLSPGSTSFFPRYHYWPGSTFVDPPKLITLNVTETTFVQLAAALAPSMAPMLGSILPQNSLDTIGIALPNDAYMFFPDPTFGGLLTVGQFNWCSKYQNYLGIPYNASAPCDAIAYSTSNLNNAQMNQYVSVVNLLLNVLTGKVSLSNLGL